MPAFYMGSIQKRYWTESYFNPPEEARAESFTTVQQAFGASSGNIAVGRGPQHECVWCSHDFRESEMVFFRGDWYCREFGHHKIIKSILAKEAADRYVPQAERDAGRIELLIDQSAKGVDVPPTIYENAIHGNLVPTVDIIPHNLKDSIWDNRNMWYNSAMWENRHYE